MDQEDINDLIAKNPSSEAGINYPRKYYNRPLPRNHTDIAHEIWEAAQLMPGEGIEDGVERIEKILNTVF